MPIQISGVQMGTLTGGPSSITLADLADVSIVSPSTGEYLRFNGLISEWQNVSIGTDVFQYLDTNLTSSNGVVLTKVPGPNTVNISLGLTASGDASGTVASGNLPLTLATVNSNVGTYGSASAIPVVTVNAKGLVTAVTTATIAAATATSLSGGTTGALPYQSAADTTAFLAAGTTSQVLVGGPSAPSWSNTPALTGTNFTGIPNAGLTNSSITIGSTAISLGASSTTLAGLTSVTSTGFTGALSGNATTATTLQTARTIATSGGATGTATSFDGSTNITIPITDLNASNLSAGTVPDARITGAYTGITNLTASGTITATTFSGALSGNATTATTTTGNASTATTLQTARTIATSGAATGTATSFDGSANITIPITALDASSLSAGTVPNGRLAGSYTGITSITSTSFVGALTGAASANVLKAGDTMTGALILSADPTVALGAATKQYVDNVATGIVAKPAVYAATTANLTSTYNNGASGVGATLTATTNGVWPGVDGVTSGWAISDGILIKNQTAQLENGRYFVSDLGSVSTPWVLTRCTYCDTAAEIPGSYTFVNAGTQAGTGWVQVVDNPATFIVGTDPIFVYQFSGSGTVTAGTGIDVTGNVISNTGVLSLTGTPNQIAVSASTGAVTLSLPSSITISGTATAATFSGALTGNATTASTLQTARTIATSGGATGTATSFDGSANITIPITALDASLLSTGTVPDARITGAYTGITNLTASGTITATTFSGALSGNATSATTATTATTTTGNAGTATILQTARTIATSGGATGTATSFDGSANITIPITALDASSLTTGTVPDARITGAYTGITNLTASGTITAATFTGALSGNATTATTLQTARTIATSGAATGTATSFNGSANITIPITALDASSLTAGTVPDARITGAYTGFTNITASGTVTAATFNATSTKRVKKYIKDISKSTTDKFLQLRPREYDRKDYLAHEFGFIAEEMAEVYPEIVGTDASGRATGIDYGKLSTILTAKVQEQQATINELKAQMSYVMNLLKGAK